MEYHIDSKEIVKKHIDELKEYKGIGKICWIKKLRTLDHIGADNNKGRRYKTFSYTIQNTKATPDERVAKVWIDETQKFFKKLYRKVKLRYLWQENKGYYIAVAGIALIIISMFLSAIK